MKKLTLHTRNTVSSVEIPVDFIDCYMPEASAEALKVYLYLQRALLDPSVILSVQDMVDLFDVTQNKVLQALHYWEQQGVLSLDFSDGSLSDITLLPLPDRNARTQAPSVKAEKPEPLPANVRPIRQEAVQDAVPPVDLTELYRESGFADLLKLAEYLLKKQLTASQQRSLGACYLLLGKDPDLLEYLLEYCIDNGHTSFRYMEKVAQTWISEGYRSVEEVKEKTQQRSKTVYSIMKAFGLQNREPVQQELVFIKAWSEHFDLPVILEACGRTMSNLHMPDFKYTNAILDRWGALGVRSLQDVAELDVKREDGKKAGNGRKKASGQAPARSSAARLTDYDGLFAEYYSS
ncbi:MAG: DnaD domain protein [Lachnospiraceae bacterium]|nr:DnaD domain protein [Lachnospiraceae bacterium]